MFLPQVDVCEGPDEIVIMVEMPGVDRQDVQISWKDNVLTSPVTNAATGRRRRKICLRRAQLRTVPPGNRHRHSDRSQKGQGRTARRTDEDPSAQTTGGAGTECNSY